jgi:predicted ATPase
VFLAPPWPEIYETDPERRHGLDVAEYSRLLETYPSLGYEVLILPNVGVSERADFILNTLDPTWTVGPVFVMQNGRNTEG